MRIIINCVISKQRIFNFFKMKKVGTVHVHVLILLTIYQNFNFKNAVVKQNILLKTLLRNLSGQHYMEYKNM